MLIKFTTSLVGCNFSYEADDVAEFPEAEAKRLIFAGFAEAEQVRPDDELETADLEDDVVEQATASTTFRAKHNAIPTKANPQ